MSPILKVIASLQFGPWKFQKLQIDPFVHLQLLSSVFLCRRRCAVSPAPWRAHPAAFCVALASTRRPDAPTALLCLALEPPRSATPPRAAVRPPPQRRRGEPAAEAAALSSHAHEHYKSPCMLILSFFCRFPVPRTQNAAAQSSSGERALTVEPLSPPFPALNRPHHPLRLILA